MAFGGTIVLKINLILSIICREYFCERSIADPTFHMMPVIEGDDNPQCRIPEVQAAVSRFTLYGSLISGILAAIISPKLGALSDRYGRTLMMCYSSLGLLVNEVIFITVAKNPEMFSVHWLLLGYAFDGLGGSFIAAMALSYAYASDCTPPHSRNVVFGWYSGCLFGGIALGPLFGAYIVKATGNMLSIFYVALGAHCAFLLFLLLIVPESLSKKRQLAAREKKEFQSAGEPMTEFIAPTDWSGLKSLFQRLLKKSNLVAPLEILWPTGPGSNPAVRRNLFFLAAVDTTMFGVAMGSMTIIIIYTNYMFGWGSFESNIFVSIINSCRVICLMVILPLITRLVRGKAGQRKQMKGCDQLDLGVIRLAIFFDMLGYIGYTLVRKGQLFIACGAIASVGGLGSPTLQSALTKHVPPDRTGQVLGAMGQLHAAARIVAPLIFNMIYAKTVGKFTQLVFVTLSATFGLAFVFAWFIRPHGEQFDTRDLSITFANMFTVYWDEPPVKIDNEEGSTAAGGANDARDV